MFLFPGFAPHCCGNHCWLGCPIRTSADQFLFADPRSFSQLTTSFLASESLGIPHTPFLTSFRFTYVLVARYTLAYLHFFTTYSFLFFLQYVNEPFVRIAPTPRFRMAIPLLRVGTNNAVTSQCSISQCANCLLLPYFNFSIFSNLVRLPATIYF